MKKPSKWEKRAFNLPDKHGWRSKPGYQIFIAGQDDVRFDLPQGWVIEPDDLGHAVHHHRLLAGTRREVRNGLG